MTTRAIEWNDIAALERALEPGDVACVLAEPAMTNAGIVLPDPGYHEALRQLTREHGTLLVIDETHTFCAGPGGYTAAAGLEPDMLTIGKAIAAGIPAAAYGMTEAVAERVTAHHRMLETSDVGGIGGTLAGNALSLAATRATLEEVLTDAAFDHMIDVAERFEAGVNGRDRRPRRALARDPARVPGRVPLPARRRRATDPRRWRLTTRCSAATCICMRSTAGSC